MEEWEHNGKGHFKDTVKAPYAESTPERHRCFTVIKVMTQVVNHCILSGQIPQDAVGNQSDTVYKKMVTIACSLKVRNMAMHSKCVIIKNLITCIILLQSVPSTGKIKCLLLKSCDSTAVQRRLFFFKGSCYLTPSMPATPASHIKRACTRWGVVQHRSGFGLDLGLVILALVLVWCVVMVL